MTKTHQYSLNLKWKGNRGTGTDSYTSYSRDHTIRVKGKSKIKCSSDPSFRGDPTRYNPEELFLASLANCHMLWYLHLCAEADVIVNSYEDTPEGIMIEEKNGSGHFTKVTLKPHVEVAAESMISKALELHHRANEMCFIANSVNFEVAHEPTCEVWLLA